MRKTAGELSLKAAADTTNYDGREVAEAQMWDVYAQIMECAKKHEHIFQEDEYCICMVRASDPLILGLVRQKYYAYLYLPSPRPEQAVFLYNKANQSFRFLWSLPPAKVMAAISETSYVSSKWERTKIWCDAFYKLNFWNVIREMHGINHLSETEYLARHRKELIKARGDQPNPVSPEPFDFSKIMMEKVIAPNKVVLDKNILNNPRKTQAFDRYVGTKVLHGQPIMS